MEAWRSKRTPWTVSGAGGRRGCSPRTGPSASSLGTCSATPRSTIIFMARPPSRKTIERLLRKKVMAGASKLDLEFLETVKSPSIPSFIARYPAISRLATMRVDGCARSPYGWRRDMSGTFPGGLARSHIDGDRHGMETVAEWQNRPLEPMYPLVFFDALHKIRTRGSCRNKAVYVALGVHAEGTNISLRSRPLKAQGLVARDQRTQEPRRRGHSDRRHIDGLEGISRGDRRGVTADDRANLRGPSHPQFHGFRLHGRTASRSRQNSQAIPGRGTRSWPTRGWRISTPASGAANIPRSRRAGGETGTCRPVLRLSVAVRRIIYTTNAIDPLNAKLRRAVRTKGINAGWRRSNCCTRLAPGRADMGNCRHANGARPRPNWLSCSTTGSSKHDGCPAPHTEFLTVPRSPRCDVALRHAPSFARDVATFEEPPQRSHADADAVFFSTCSSAKVMSDLPAAGVLSRSA